MECRDWWGKRLEQRGQPAVEWGHSGWWEQSGPRAVAGQLWAAASVRGAISAASLWAERSLCSRPVEWLTLGRIAGGLIRLVGLIDLEGFILILVVVAALIGALIWKPWERISNDAGAPSSESSAISEEPSNETTEEATTEPEDTTTEKTEDTTTERTTTTTSRQATGTDIPGLGRQGFTANSAATCNADDEWVYAGVNEDGDKVVICQVGDTDGFYYRGWYHEGALERDVTSRSPDGRSYSMKSGGTVINIDGSALSVVQNGKTFSSTVFDDVATREPDWG